MKAAEPTVYFSLINDASVPHFVFVLSKCKIPFSIVETGPSYAKMTIYLAFSVELKQPKTPIFTGFLLT